MKTQAVMALALLAGPGTSDAMAADLIPLEWSTEGSFARELPVAAGKFVEVCGSLPAGAKVAWRYDASAPLNFNIHYHEGKQVHFPARKDQVSQLAGTLNAKLAQDYCWMWTNKGSGPATLKLALRRG